MDRSPFLGVNEQDWIASNELAFAFHDRFPVTRGHALVVTRRVVPTWFCMHDAHGQPWLATLALENCSETALIVICFWFPGGARERVDFRNENRTAHGFQRGDG